MSISSRDALIVCTLNLTDLAKEEVAVIEKINEFAELLINKGGFRVKFLPCNEKKIRLGDSEKTVLELCTTETVEKANLEVAIEQLFNPKDTSSLPDTALLFFFGHGLREEKSGEDTYEGYLVPNNIRLEDANPTNCLSLTWLNKQLDKSPIKRQIVFLETCYSGEFVKNIKINQEKEALFITAARAHEEALADEGLLTNALLKILDYEKSQPKDTPWVTSDALMKGLESELSESIGWQRFEKILQGRPIVLTNKAFNRDVDPDAVPYKALLPFENKAEDALYFKGREKLTEELIQKVKEKSFLAVLGASGNGKSSVVKAGVLYQSSQTERWEILMPFAPTADPLNTLDILSRIRTSPQERVILTIDQFEEVFSLCQDENTRQTFFEQLLDAVEQAAGKLCLIVVMRADFLDKCSNYPRLARYFQNHQHIVTRPEETEIEAMIKEPAERAGLSVEPRLVAEMITDFKNSIGSLPLLEFALTELWKLSKTDRLLRYSDYKDLGRIEGILEKKATETYENLTPVEQAVAKRIFLALTSLGEGNPDTRRQESRANLLEFTTEPQSVVEAVIKKLADEHLIVTGKTDATDKIETGAVNIAHDALIQHWSLLRKWLNLSRDDMKLQRQIDEGAKAWQKGEKELLAGVDLELAEKYLETHLKRVSLSEIGIEFVKASVALREKEVQEREQQRRERERLQQRNVLILSVSLAVMIWLAVFGWWQWRDAEKQRKEAERQENLAQMSDTRSQSLLALEAPNSAQNYDTALLLAVKSFQQNKDSIENKSNLLRVLQGNPKIKTYLWHPENGGVTGIAINKRGELAATYDESGALLLWNVDKLSQRQIPGNYQKVTNLVFHPNNDDLLVITDRQGEVRFLNISDGSETSPIKHTDSVTGAVFSPDGRWLATSSRDKTVNLHDINQSQNICLKHEGEVMGVAFDSKSQLLFTAVTLDAVTLDQGGSRLLSWNIAGMVPTKECLVDPQKVEWESREPSDEITSIITSGNVLAFSLYDKMLKQDLREYLDPNVRVAWEQFMGHRGRVTNMTVSNNSNKINKLFSASFDNTIRMWDVSKRNPDGAVLHGHKNFVRSVVARPDSSQIISSSWDGSIILWDSDAQIQSHLVEYLKESRDRLENLNFYAPNVVLFSEHTDDKMNFIKSLDLSACQDGKCQEKIIFPKKSDGLIANTFIQGDQLTISDDKLGISIVNINTGVEEKVILSKPETDIKTVVVSADKKWFATVDNNKVLVVKGIDNQSSLEYIDENVQVVECDHDSNSCVYVTDDDSVKLLDIRNGAFQVREFGSHKGANKIVFDNTGKVVATGGDQTVKLWSLKIEPTSELKPIAELKGHTGEIIGITFSPDGKLLASVGRDRTLRIWDTSNTMVTEMSVGDYFDLDECCFVASNPVSFSPDGKKIVALVKNQGKYRIAMLDVDPQSWEKKACSIANRNLTDQEWKRYFDQEAYRKICQ